MKKGFSLMEIIVVIAIMLVIIVSVSQVFPRLVSSFRMVTPSVKASYLLEEGAEVAKIFGVESWIKNISPLQNSVPYRIAFDKQNVKWATTSSTDLIDKTYDRTIIFGPVYRDMDGRISSSGILDINSRKVDVDVSWQTNTGETTKTLTTYVFNLSKN